MFLFGSSFSQTVGVKYNFIGDVGLKKQVNVNVQRKQCEENLADLESITDNMLKDKHPTPVTRPRTCFQVKAAC